MDQRKRRFISLLLSVVLLIALTGCSAGGQTSEGGQSGGQSGGQIPVGQDDGGKEGAKGRYVEQLLEIPKGYDGDGSMGILEDGSWKLIDVKNGTVSISRDKGKSWDTKENEELARLLNLEQADITSAAVAPDGGMFISYVVWGNSSGGKGFPEKYIYFDKKGKKDEFELGLEKYKAGAVQAVFSGNKSVFLLTNSDRVYEVDLKKHKAYERLDFMGTSWFGLFPCGDTVAAACRDKVYLYDADKKTMEASDPGLNEYIQGEKSEYVILGAGEEGKILAASPAGIFSHVKGGNVTEQLADGNLITLGSPSQKASQVFALAGGEIVILYANGEIDSYAYDPEALAVPDRQLSVYSLYDNITVRQAVYAFRRKHQDVYVKVVNALSGGDGVTEDDAIRNLNTEILAGKGPDVILMDGLPIDSYVEKGMLVELDELLAQVQTEGSFYTNILESCQTGGKIYTVPIRFSVPLVVGDSDAISKITDLGALADVVEKLAEGDVKQTVLGLYNEKEVLARLWTVCAGTWNEGTTTVDKQALVELLTQAKRIYEAEQKNLDQKKKKEHEERVINLESEEEKPGADYDPQSGEWLVNDLMMGRQKITAGLYRGMSDMRMLSSVMNKEKTLSWQKWQGQKKDVFVPAGLAAISTAASDKELATEFVKTMLGIDVQQKDLGDGFPVNNEAFAKFSENPNVGTDVGLAVSDSDDPGSVYELDLIWPSEKQLGEMEDMFQSLKTPVNTTGNVREQVLSIGAAALSGEKGIEESAQEIYEKIQLLGQE